MGLDIWVGWPGQTREELDAAMDGDLEEGQIGFIRDSYNETSFHRWATTRLGGRDWTWMFDYSDDKLVEIDDPISGEKQGVFFPDWKASLLRAEQACEMASAITDHYFVVPFPKPTRDPSTLPDQFDVVDAFLADRQSLNSMLASPILPKTANGRFATNLVKIEGVMWCQFDVYEPGKPPAVDIQPVLVCEGNERVTLAMRGAIDAAISLIRFGEAKNGWLHWSY